MLVLGSHSQTIFDTIDGFTGKVMLPVHWGLFNLALHGWTEPVEAWTPLDGVLAEHDGRRAIVDLATDHDAAANIANAIAAGPVTEISLEPPGLDELFVELVEGDA